MDNKYGMPDPNKYTSELGGLDKSPSGKDGNTQSNAPKVEHTLNIYAALPILKSLYGMHADEDDFIDLAINSLADIRHFGTEKYIAKVIVGEGGVVPLPCNAEIIDAVCTPLVAKKTFSSRIKYELLDEYNQDGYIRASDVMHTLRVGHSSWGLHQGAYASERLNRNIPTMAVPFNEGYIDYRLGRGSMTIDKCYVGEEICIAFTGIMTDLEGFPMITRKQANALAAITAKSLALKASMKGDKNMAAMLQYLGGEAGRLKQAASIAEDISDNELDDLMDAKTTFNRKSVNRPIRYER